MKNNLKNLFHSLLNGKYGEFLRYSLVGVVTTTINFCVYLILYRFFAVNVTISNSVAVIFANAYSYIGNKRHVFRTHCKDKKAFIREFSLFFTSRAGTILLEVIGVPAVIKLSGEPPMLAKIEIFVLVVVLNYIVSKFIVFQEKLSDNDPKK